MRGEHLRCRQLRVVSRALTSAKRTLPLAKELVIRGKRDHGRHRECSMCAFQVVVAQLLVSLKLYRDKLCSMLDGRFGPRGVPIMAFHVTFESRLPTGNYHEFRLEPRKS